ncbi:MAG: hypothetical protein NTW96_10720 [Planctomycetia bacterium]|nr:hypothetical protein [Planctomycetia bacterium]
MPMQPLCLTWMLRTYRVSRDVTLVGTAGAVLFAMAFFPPCACGFALMPGWKAAAIRLSWVAIVMALGASTAAAVCLGAVLWLKFRVRCPAMILAFAGFLLVLAMSLSLLPCGRRPSSFNTPRRPSECRPHVLTIHR